MIKPAPLLALAFLATFAIVQEAHATPVSFDRDSFAPSNGFGFFQNDDQEEAPGEQEDFFSSPSGGYGSDLRAFADAWHGRGRHHHGHHGNDCCECGSPCDPGVDPTPPPSPVPLPAALPLMGFGLLGLGVARKRKA